jgi:hypothetical protein
VATLKKIFMPACWCCCRKDAAYGAGLSAREAHVGGERSSPTLTGCLRRHVPFRIACHAPSITRSIPSGYFHVRCQCPSSAPVRPRTGRTDSLVALDHAQLCKTLAGLLGPTVIQGLPVIAGKQLAKAEMRVLKHHHRLEAEVKTAARVEPSRIMDAAPI